MKRQFRKFRAGGVGLLLATFGPVRAAESMPVASLDLHGYRPTSSSVMAPVRPLADWLGVRLTVESESVVLSSSEKTVVVEKGKHRILINDQSRLLSSAPLVKDGQLLVPLREMAEAFGAKAIYRSGGYADGASQAYHGGVVLQLGERQLWVPIYEASPATMTKSLSEIDAVVPGTYGEDWLLRERQPFGAFALISVQPIEQEEIQRFLLQRRGNEWHLLASAAGGARVAKHYVDRLMAQGDPAGWRQAIEFLTSDPPAGARITPDIPQRTLYSALETVRDVYLDGLGPAIRPHNDTSVQVVKAQRQQLAFYTWFIQSYAKQAEDRAMAEALYQRARLYWARGDLAAAKQAFRQILKEFGGTVMLHGPNGRETYRQVLSSTLWVTVAEKTPVYSYNYGETSRDAPVIAKQVRFEPKHTLMVAYPGSLLHGPSGGRQTAAFFRKRLKLWEGGLVVPKHHCITVAEFSRRS